VLDKASWLAGASANSTLDRPCWAGRGNSATAGPVDKTAGGSFVASLETISDAVFRRVCLSVDIGWEEFSFPMIVGGAGWMLSGMIPFASAVDVVASG